MQMTNRDLLKIIALRQSFLATVGSLDTDTIAKLVLLYAFIIIFPALLLKRNVRKVNDS